MQLKANPDSHHIDMRYPTDNSLAQRPKNSKVLQHTLHRVCVLLSNIHLLIPKAHWMAALQTWRIANDMNIPTTTYDGFSPTAPSCDLRQSSRDS